MIAFPESLCITIATDACDILTTYKVLVQTETLFTTDSSPSWSMDLESNDKSTNPAWLIMNDHNSVFEN